MQSSEAISVAGRTTSNPALDFHIPPGDPDMDLHLLIDRYITDVMNSDVYRWGSSATAYPTGVEILDKDLPAQARLALVIMQWWIRSREDGAWIDSLHNEHYRVSYGMSVLVQSMLRRKLPFTSGELARLIRDLTRATATYYYSWFSYPSIVGQAEKYLKKDMLDDELRGALVWLRDGHLKTQQYGDYRKLIARISKMLGEGEPVTVPLPGERWTDAALGDLGAMEPQRRELWDALLAHTMKATSSTPSGAWSRNAKTLLDAVGVSEFSAIVARWFSLVGASGEKPIDDDRSQALKGLLWFCSLAGADAPASAICDLGIIGFKKISGHGPRSQKVGNAAIHALGELPGLEGVAQLNRLRLKIRQAQAIAAVDRALGRAAEAAGLTMADLEEISIPTYGVERRRLRREFGEYSAELRITDALQVETCWLGPDGRERKSVPTAVKSEHAAELAALKQTAKEMQGMLSAQRERLERLLLAERQLPYAAWRERYLEHPIVGETARRLIWRLGEGERERLCIWHDGMLVDSRGRDIGPVDPETTVMLWHPITSDAATVLEWRIWIELKEVVQPFKQAHREVYLLTDAEIATGVYSNRFAAHILKHHQFAALCRARGWTYALSGAFDCGDNTPMLVLPQWNLAVEFWVTGTGADDLSNSGIYLYVATDQVRFYPLDAMTAYQRPGPLSLDRIPPIVLSEVMRDVDLFVGVCSVGNDPAWNDNGPAGMNRYWHDYSFGELSTSAVTRKDVLMRLIPRMKIADRCSFDGSFLVVKGNIRTYRIHLGSGNILMDPNSQYLCIVPDRRGSAEREGKVFLPFEGDATLSLIISKALLLADDEAITDSTIVSQIHAARV